MVNIFKRIGAFFLDLIQVIVLGLSFFVLVYLFLWQPHQVKGSSMFPNFHDKDLLLTDKITYRFSLPKRGDVIIFKAPAGEPCADIECEYIKRVIGLPGDTVKVEKGSIYINGQSLNEEYLSKNIVNNYGSYLREGIEQKIPQGEYLPLGDNREHSRDGREFGSIPKESIIGKAWLRYWPINDFGLIKNPKYNIN